MASYRHFGAVSRAVLDALQQQLGLLHAAHQRAHLSAPGAASADRGGTYSGTSVNRQSLINRHHTTWRLEEDGISLEVPKLSPGLYFRPYEAMNS